MFCDKNFVYALLLVTFLGSIDLAHAEIQESNGVIAVVNGVNILYGDIRIKPQSIPPAYAEDMNVAQLHKEVQMQELRQLVRQTHNIIFEQKVVELGITVTEKEIDLRVEEIFQKTGVTNEKAKAVCDSAQAVYKALIEWQKNPSDGDMIYNNMLADSLISKEQWESYQAYYDTPGKLTHLFVPKDINDMKKNSRGSSKKDICYKKLNDIITRGVSVTTDDIQLEYQIRYKNISPKPSWDTVKDMIGTELLAQKKREAEIRWWQKQYQESNIEVKDERFKNLKDLLLNRKIKPEN